MRRLVCAAVLALAMALPGLAFAENLELPVVVRRGPVVVRAQAGLERDAKRIAEKVPKKLREIAADLPELPTPSSVEIRLVRRAADLPRVAPQGRGAPPWAVGVAYRGTNIITVAARNKHQPNDVDETAAHELAHLALDTAMGDKHIPRWLNEGFAYIHSSTFSIARARTLTGMAWTGNVVPLPDLDSRFPAQEIAVGKAYAQSYDFVSYLAIRGRYRDKDDDGDRWPFRDYLADLARGADQDTAALRNFGANMDQLFREWVEDMRSRYMLSPIGLFGILVWAIGGLLLVIAFFRKRRLGREKLARWDDEERARDVLNALVPLKDPDDGPPREDA